MRRGIVTAAIAVAALGTAATAHAEPAKAAPTATFVVADDAQSVAVRLSDGTTAASIPMRVAVDGEQLALRPTVENDGRTLLLSPISNADRWNTELQHATFGALIGGAIGFVLGLPVGAFILPIVATTALGAAIGFVIAGGQPLVDAGIAYFTGQPDAPTPSDAPAQ